MKSILIRSFAVAMLAGSISAFAATAPSKDDPPKEKMSRACSPDAAIDQLEKEVHQLEAKDKLNQEEEQKTIQKDKNQIRQENKQWHDSLLGIYG